MERRVIRVRGSATISEKPDWVVISFEIAGRSPDYATCTAELAFLTERLRDELESIGIERENLKTGHLSVSTDFEYQENRRVFIGYKASHDLKLEFSLDTEQLHRVLEKLSNTESKSEFKVKFTVKDPEPLREKALAEAVRKAKMKAQLLADAAGVSLGSLLQIDYSWSEIYIQSSSEMVMEFSPATYDYTITPEDIELKESVNVVWEIVE